MQTRRLLDFEMGLSAAQLPGYLEEALRRETRGSVSVQRSAPEQAFQPESTPGQVSELAGSNPFYACAEGRLTEESVSAE